MRHKKIKNLFNIISGLLIITVFNSPLSAKGDIYAVGCIDNYPYEFINESGVPSGFSVELLKSIAGELKINCRIELVTYERFVDLQKNPDVDIILGMIRGSSTAGYQFFRANMKIHFSIFANSDSGVSSINDLRDLKIIIAAHDSISYQIADEIKKFIKFKPALTNNETLAFTQLKRADCDAVVMSGSSAGRIIANRHLVGIKELPVSIGFFDYGFGVRKSNAEIRDILKEGYDRIFSNGVYERIYREWLSAEPDDSFLSERGVYLSGGIFGFLMFILFLIINGFILGKRIREKTENLNLSMTELSKIQLQLHESEKRFKRIFDRSPSALMILNSSGKVLLFNDAVVEIFGVNNPDEITNLDIINSPLSTEWFKSRLKNYRDINLEMKFNFEIIKKTGYYSTCKTGIMVLELIIMSVEINAGSPDPGFICQFNDNTQERLLLEEIKYNQRKLELIFEGIKDGLWEWNIFTGKVRYNRKFFSFLGYKPELFPDDITTLIGFIHESERESVKNELFEKVANGRSFNIEYRMVMSNGKLIYVRSRGETIEWDDNLKPLRIIGIQTEISIQRSIDNRINLFQNDDLKPDFNYIGCSEDILNGKTILMVDDNYLIFLYMSELLKRYNAKTLYASSGNDAIEIVRSRDDLCLIVLDHHMPGLNGVSALREIRKINYHIPVVVHTGESHGDVNELFLGEGFSGVLIKPVEENKLIETICSLIN